MAILHSPSASNNFSKQVYTPCAGHNHNHKTSSIAPEPFRAAVRRERRREPPGHNTISETILKEGWAARAHWAPLGSPGRHRHGAWPPKAQAPRVRPTPEPAPQRDRTIIPGGPWRQPSVAAPPPTANISRPHPVSQNQTRWVFRDPGSVKRAQPPHSGAGGRPGDVFDRPRTWAFPKAGAAAGEKRRAQPLEER